LACHPDVGGAALGDAMVVGLTSMGAAVVPLWPHVVLPLIAPALITSFICTLVALFALGVAKGRIARQAWQRGLAGHADRFGTHRWCFTDVPVTRAREP
jgi:VIT1/CCC1 family predicted Fe2+/Mn2+ transporter